MRRRHTRGGLLLVLLATASAAAPVVAEEALVGAIATEFREPLQRCTWIAGHFDSIERRLALYRDEIATVLVTADGARVGDSASGVVQFVAFESRLVGPASVTISLNARSASAQDRLQPGRRVELWFTEKSGRMHPLFCGAAAVVRSDVANARIVLTALIPRIGAELQESVTYRDQTCVEILSGLAQSAGLVADIRVQSAMRASPETARHAQADWPFMRQLGAQCRLDVVVRSDGRLSISDSGYAPPPAPVKRSWTQVTWVDIAGQMAANQGRVLEARLRGVYPKMTVLQAVDDDTFLLDVAIAAGASAWYAPGKLLLAEDAFWSAQPAAPVLPAGASDLLLKRVVVTGAAGSQHTFTRRVADPRIQARDPERIAAVEAVLLLGSAMPVGTAPPTPLADGVRISQALDAALARLDAQATSTAQQQFMRDLARVYRPTVRHVYRLRPDGLQALDAIGR